MTMRPGHPCASTATRLVSALVVGLAFTQPTPSVLAQAPSAALQDPLLLPVATIAHVPLTAAYDALSVPSLAAGLSYRDPTTGVRVYKLTSATFPASRPSWGHNYAEGGNEVSLPYDGETRAVLVYDGSQHRLIDFTPGVGVSNPRPLSDPFRPIQDLSFTFSNNPATPYYAYVANGDSSIIRMDIRTMTRADGDGWPVTDEPDGLWLHQSENDGMFVWMRGALGPTTVIYEPSSGIKKTYTSSDVNEPRIDRAGRYVGFSLDTPLNGLAVWDWETDGIVWTTPADSDTPFAHVASLRRRWLGVDWSMTFPPEFVMFTPDVPDSVTHVGGPANATLVHGNGNWIQYPADLDDQWAMFTHYGSLRPEESYWLAPGGMVLITANGQRRVLAHPYNTRDEYTFFSFAKFSSDGRYVLFTSNMNGSGRSDLFLAEMPRAGSETSPPTVSITAPADGALVSGTVSVAADASDDVWVVGVQFEVDGSPLGPEDTSAPYGVSWGTAVSRDGSHSLTAVARDLAGNATVSSPVVVNVQNPPVLSAVSATSVTASGATIVWTTNEPADAQVDYGLTTAYGSSTTLDASLLLAHSRALTGLANGTLYHYRVRSRDAAGNLGVSSDRTFVTVDNVGPVISLVSATNITSSGATIVWTTNEPANTQVNYGRTTSYGSNAPATGPNPSLVLAHSQALTGLLPSTLYHYRVRSRDAAGNLTISTDFVLTTAAIPLTCPVSPVPASAPFNATVRGGGSAKDWVASYVPGAPDVPWLGAFQYVLLPRPTTVTMTAPATGGMYDLRLFANDSYTLIASCTYQVTPPTPSLSIDGVTVTEGNAGTVNATFNVTLSSAPAGTVTVTFATANGTATAGADYVPNSGILTFAAGETVKTVAVVVKGDTTVEADESFLVDLSAPSGATISQGHGQGAIVDDDNEVTCPVSPVLPGVTFTTVVSGPGTAADWVASYAPGAANAAWAGQYKYVPMPRPTPVMMTAPVVGGTYELRLLANDAYTMLAACTYQVAGSLAIDGVTVTEGNVGTTSATFHVTLFPASTGTVSVNFATANGTAAAGEDYVATSGTLTFEPGESVKTVTVLVNGDTAPEASETFFLDLSAPSDATISQSRGQGTIVDDEVTCPVSPVEPGATFTIVVSGGSTPADWIASYASGALDTSWTGQYQYVTLPRPASVTLTAPVVGGTYELRLFADDTYTAMGSCTYVVEP